MPSERTTILSAPATVRILWAITRTVLSAIRRERAVCIRVSFSTSREAVASSKRMIGAFFRNARAIEIRWRSPPESSQPFSPILVCHPSGNFSANSSTLASFAAAMTCSSVASLFPIRIFSRIVLSNSVTSWNTMEYRESSVSGSIRDTSMPPTVIFPLLISQNLAASRDTVVFPPPDGPTKAVTSPCFAVKETSFNTVSPVL